LRPLHFLGMLRVAKVLRRLVAWLLVPGAVLVLLLAIVMIVVGDSVRRR